MMLGQIRVEFIFGIVIFGLIIFFIVSQTNVVLSIVLADSKSNYIKAKAIGVLTILLEDKGEPEDWETNIGETKRVGLADQPYKLSKSKVNVLKDNCDLLENFNLGGYRLLIYNSTHRVLFCGIESLDPVTAIMYRYVFIDQNFGNVTLEVW